MGEVLGYGASDVTQHSSGVFELVQAAWGGAALRAIDGVETIVR
ncbi:hypothetical protein AKJ09_02251 [Labilithrix luteola]|uniref:Uncharacterized protein n=1 Tax=Labilithrix luteola TaxID=1391654 RepID=A0A0K1PPY9_9BACT|nr:hypothetical protein [Labilithrix luteola]AKU95587.1 hypothetical protein AKJ09_02251 [Labilithrix luteola]